MNSLNIHKRYAAKVKDSDEFVDGSLFYDFDHGCWRIITYLFDLEEPSLDNQFGVSAEEIDESTLEIVELKW